MERLLKVIKDIYVNLAIRLLIQTIFKVTHCSKKSDKYRNLLIGGILDNKTYKAIAEETDSSISTIYTHALRVMEQVVNTSKGQLLECSVESDET